MSAVVLGVGEEVESQAFVIFEMVSGARLNDIGGGDV